LVDTSQVLYEIRLPGLEPWRRGKVRTVYEADGYLVIVASDRLSAYDCVLPTPIPGKGEVLTRLSLFWFEKLTSARPHHLVGSDPLCYPPPFDLHGSRLTGRSMLVQRAERLDVECVVRGYLTGSGWKEYRTDGAVCGIRLPAGLHDGALLDPPIFTPATKEESGHDQNISFDEMVRRVGPGLAEQLRARSLAIYREAHAWAWGHGLVLADTKFEFGLVAGVVTLIDEVLSPDSSRYWDRDAYERGKLFSFDKQFVRDYLDRSGWNHEPPAPELPADVVAATTQRYREALLRLAGEE
jgi:phosphoribosylaminoimidazole-succinocarboxamide synthase